jgi:hypothetical protein
VNVRAQPFARALAPGLLLVVACASGTETDNPASGPLVRFDASACKTEPVERSTAPGRSTDAFVTTSDDDGLSCVEWERREDGELALRFLNVTGPCSVEWRGTATARADGGLDVLAKNPSCEIARCGSCLYDFELAVKDTVPSGLSVTLALANCKGELSEQTLSVVLPADAADSGIRCRYADGSAYGQQLAQEGRCGSRFSPCGAGSISCPENTSCTAGLACTELGDGVGSMLCLASCTADEGCSPTGVTRCENGVCSVPPAF